MSVTYVIFPVLMRTQRVTIHIFLTTRSGPGCLDLKTYHLTSVIHLGCSDFFNSTLDLSRENAFDIPVQFMEFNNIDDNLYKYCFYQYLCITYKMNIFSLL